MSKARYAEDEGIMTAFLEHYRVVDIMKATNLSRNTVVKIRDDPDFQKALKKRKSQIVKAAVNRMQSHVCDYIMILEWIAKSSDSPRQVRINAIQILLSQLREWTNTYELYERIEALEK